MADEPVDVTSMDVKQLRKIAWFHQAYRANIEAALDDVERLDGVRRKRPEGAGDGAVGAIRLIAQQRDEALLELQTWRGDGWAASEPEHSLVLLDADGVERPVCQRARFQFSEGNPVTVVMCGKCTACAGVGPDRHA